MHMLCRLASNLHVHAGIWKCLQQKGGGTKSGTVCWQEVEVAPDVDYAQLAALMEGYSGDDVTNVCRDAAMNGMRQAIAGKTPAQIRCELTSMQRCMCMHALQHACMFDEANSTSEQARSSFNVCRLPAGGARCWQLPFLSPSDQAGRATCIVSAQGHPAGGCEPTGLHGGFPAGAHCAAPLQASLAERMHKLCTLTPGAGAFV